MAKNNRILMDSDGNIISILSAPTDTLGTSSHTTHRTSRAIHSATLSHTSMTSQKYKNWMEVATQYICLALLVSVFVVAASAQFSVEAVSSVSDTDCVVSEADITTAAIPTTTTTKSTALTTATTTTTTANSTTNKSTTTTAATKATTAKATVTSKVPVSEDVLRFFAGVLFFEQGDSCKKGQYAVGHVILNRMGNNMTEKKLMEVITASYQFDSVSTDKNHWQKYGITSSQLQSISYNGKTYYTKKATSQSLEVAKELLNGTSKNPIGNRKSFREKSYFANRKNSTFANVTDAITIGGNTYFTDK